MRDITAKRKFRTTSKEFPGLEFKVAMHITTDVNIKEPINGKTGFICAKATNPKTGEEWSYWAPEHLFWKKFKRIEE